MSLRPVWEAPTTPMRRSRLPRARHREVLERCERKASRARNAPLLAKRIAARAYSATGWALAHAAEVTVMPDAHSAGLANGLSGTGSGISHTARSRSHKCGSNAVVETWSAIANTAVGFCVPEGTSAT